MILKCFRDLDGRWVMRGITYAICCQYHSTILSVTEGLGELAAVCWLYACLNEIGAFSGLEKVIGIRGIAHLIHSYRCSSILSAAGILQELTAMNNIVEAFSRFGRMGGWCEALCTLSTAANIQAYCQSPEHCANLLLYACLNDIKAFAGLG